MSYSVYRTDKANEQLYDIFHYIAVEAGSVDTALSYLSELEEAIMSLREMPYRGSMPRYRILKRQGYRVLIVGRHLVFYRVDENAKRVVVYAVVDSRREYVTLI